MIDRESLYSAATDLFNNISEIKISSTRYTDSSIKILKKLKKKHRQNDLRNAKCLYKLWINPNVQTELRRRFKANSAATNELLQNQPNTEPIDGEDENRNETNEIDVTEEHVSTGQEEIDENVLDGSSLNQGIAPEEQLGTPHEEQIIQTKTHVDDARQYEEKILVLQAHLKTAQNALESRKLENVVQFNVTKEFEEKIDSLQKTLHERDESIDKIQETNEILQAKLDESVQCGEKAAKLEFDYGQLDRKMSLMKEKYEQLRLEKSSLQQHVDALQNSSSDTISDVHRLTAELQQKQKSHEELLDKSKSIQLSLEKTLHETSLNLANKTTQLELVKAEMETVAMQKVERENQFNSELANIKEAATKEKSYLIHEIDSMKEERERLLKEIDKKLKPSEVLRRKIDYLVKNVDQLQGEVEKSKKEIAQKEGEFEAKMNVLRSVEDTLKKQLYESSRKFSELQTTFNEATKFGGENIDQLKTQLSEMSVHCKKLELNIKSLQTTYDNVTVENNELKIKLLGVEKTKEEILESIKVQKDLFNKKETMMERQLQEVKSKFKSTKDKQFDLVNRNVELVQQNEDLTKRLLESKNSKSEMTDQLAKDRTQFEAFKLSTEAEKSDIDAKLAESHRREIEFSDNAKLLASQILHLKATIEDKQKEIEVIAGNLREAQDAYEEQKSNAAAFSESTQCEINSLQHDAAERIKSTRALKEKIEEHASSANLSDDLKHQLNQKSDEVKSMNFQLDTIKKALEDKIEELTRVSDERSLLLSTKSSLDEEISRLNSQIKHFADNFVIRPVSNDLKEECGICEKAKNMGIVEEEKESEPELLNVLPKVFSIRCICGLYNDEGSKIQCSKCKVLQHTACIGSDINAETYFCELCDKRPVNLEIALDEYSDEGNHYYLTLMRGDMQIRQSETVYILRDIPMNPGSICHTEKHSYKTICKIDYNECDIFRIEQLWKDCDGKRFVYGHHYLRPQETYHEPTRKFYKNEIVRVPSYEILPIDIIVGRCWVLDPITYCIGRPLDCDEDHVYICEMRVDKNARTFTKIARKLPVCTEPSAFKTFGLKLKILRDFSPHPLPTMSNKRNKRIHSDSRNTVEKRKRIVGKYKLNQ